MCESLHFDPRRSLGQVGSTFRSTLISHESVTRNLDVPVRSYEFFEDFLTRCWQIQANWLSRPPALETACLAAAHTLSPSTNGGSPTALLPRRLIGLSESSRKRDSKISRDTVDRRDLVLVRRIREQLAVFRVEQLFGGGPAHSLHKAADHLAAVDGRVDRPAEVEQDVNPRDRKLAGESVDHNFGNGRSVRVVQERRALAGLAVEVDAGRGVESSRSQVDAIGVGQPHELAETDPVDRGRCGSNTHPFSKAISGNGCRRGRGRGKMTRRGSGEPLLEISQARRAAVPFKSVEAEAAVGEVLLFFSVDVGSHPDGLDRQRETVGDQLADLGEETLPHLRAAGRDLDRAVQVDIDQGARLVQNGVRERDAELDRNQSDIPRRWVRRGSIPLRGLVAAPLVLG